MQADEKAIPDSYWVLPGRLMAGEYPCSPDEAQARDKLRWLLGAGVTFCLDLTEEGEYGLRSYAPLLFEEAGALGKQVVHRRMSIPDMGIPSQAEMRLILETIASALESGHTIYVHCYGGIGRTGSVVGCYLVQQGMQGAAALAQIARWRERTPNGWRRSPETDAQVELVMNWKG